jgi:hypothetical protein
MADLAAAVREKLSERSAGLQRSQTASSNISNFMRTADNYFATNTHNMMY